MSDAAGGGAAVSAAAGGGGPAAAKAKTAVEVIEAAAARTAAGASDEEGISWEYLVKFKGRGYIHAAWVPDDTMRAAGKLVPTVARKVQNFLRSPAADGVCPPPPFSK